MKILQTAAGPLEIPQTAKEIAAHNARADRNVAILQDLWEELDRKPTIAELEAAYAARR